MFITFVTGTQSRRVSLVYTKRWIGTVRFFKSFTIVFDVWWGLEMNMLITCCFWRELNGWFLILAQFNLEQFHGEFLSINTICLLKDVSSFQVLTMTLSGYFRESLSEMLVASSDRECLLLSVIFYHKSEWLLLVQPFSFGQEFKDAIPFDWKRVVVPSSCT